LIEEIAEIDTKISQELSKKNWDHHYRWSFFF
jgi:hypothetical protein